MKRVYKEWIKEIIQIINETDFSEYNFDTQKTITLPYLGELRVVKDVVDRMNRNKEKHGRTKVKEDTGEK